MEEFLKWLGRENVILGVLILFGGVLVKWFGSKADYCIENIVKPVAERHIKLMDTLGENDTKKTAALRDIGSDVEEIRETQKKHIDICRTPA